MIDFNELKNYQKKLQQEYKDKTSFPFLKFHKEMLKKCDKWLDEVFKSPVIEENIQAAAMEAIKKEPFANHSYYVPVNFDIIVDLDCGGSVEVVVGDTIKYGTFTGEVIEFGLKSTKIKDVSGNVLMVANRNIMEVINISQKENSIPIILPLPYEVAPAKIEKLIKVMCIIIISPGIHLSFILICKKGLKSFLKNIPN